MNKRVLFRNAAKAAAVGAAAAATVASAQFVSDDAVNLSAVFSAAIAAIIAYLKQSPLFK